MLHTKPVELKSRIEAADKKNCNKRRDVSRYTIPDIPGVFRECTHDIANELSLSANNFSLRKSPKKPGIDPVFFEPAIRHARRESSGVAFRERLQRRCDRTAFDAASVFYVFDGALNGTVNRAERGPVTLSTVIEAAMAPCSRPPRPA